MNFKTPRIISTISALTLFFAATGAQAAAQEIPAAPWHPTGFLHAITASILFGLIGIVLAIIGFKLFDLVTPFNLEKEIQEKNLAAGILCAAIVLGICHIIAASMS